MSSAPCCPEGLEAPAPRSVFIHSGLAGGAEWLEALGEGLTNIGTELPRGAGVQQELGETAGARGAPSAAVEGEG